MMRLIVLVRWNGARMIVNIDRNLSSNVTENSLIDKYLSARLQDDEDEEDTVRDQLLDAIYEAGKALLDNLRPAIDARTKRPAFSSLSAGILLHLSYCGRRTEVSLGGVPST